MNKIFTTKWGRIMKICATQGFIAMMLCGMSFAHDNHAQVLDRTVTLSIEDATFEQALRELAHATQAFFAYSPELLNIQDHISLTGKDKPLREILDQLLLPRSISYTVHQDDVTIFLKPTYEPRQNNQTILKPEEVRDLKQMITGIIRNQHNEPMPGVNVMIKGTSNGTISDNAGAYSIDAEPSDVIVFSFVGFSKIEARVGSQTTMDVTMQEELQSLNEVVINAGYWEVKEKEQTGSISRLTAADIDKQPISNPLQAMQGRMPGVYIEQNTGVPGGGFSIQVRGQNSLRTGSGNSVNGNLPLYLVDGVPFTSTALTAGSLTSANLRGGNPLSAINPNDIESIEVLKDADATAIYGSRGANGVVLITTKRAKTGKPSLDVNVSTGVGKVTRRMKLLTTPQYLEMRKEAVEADGYTALIGDPQYDVVWPDLSVWDSTRFTDWQEKLIGGTAQITNAQASFSGGTAQTQYLVGGSFYTESTVFPGNNDFKRGSGRMTLNHTSQNKKFNLMASVNYTGSISDIPSADFATLAVTLAPNAPALRDAAGNLNWENDTWTNPLSQLERKYTNTINNWVSNLTTSYELFEGFRAKTNVGFTRMDVREMRLSPLSAYNPNDLAGRTGSSTFGNSDIHTWIVEPQLDYTKSILKGQFIASMGGTIQESVQQGSTLLANGYTNDALLENIGAAASVSISNTSYAQYRYAALFARINYIWNDKLILNLTGRRDGSSRFGSGKQYGNFGAVGAAWIFSNERLFSQKLKFISFGKIRSSFGTTGSDAIGNYQFLETYASTTHPYNGSSGLVLNRLSNPDYSWETNRKAEVALDLGVWRDRLRLSVAYYNNRSSNQLVGLPLPVMTGQASVQFNLPAEVENKGWEFQWTSINITRANFEWTTSINLTLPENRLVSFPDLDKFPAYLNRYQVGKSVYSFMGLHYTGLNPATGVYEFADRNDNGGLDSGDNTIRAQVTQTAYGGVNNSIRYKSFHLDFFVQVVRQTGFNYQRSFSYPGTFSNQPEIVMNRWQTENDNTSIQKFTAFDPTGMVSLAYSYAQFSDAAVVDASFIRLKNISLSWELPQTWIAKSFMQSARIYLQGQNLLTITDYIGLDPENQSSTVIPPLTMMNVGVQLKL